jgi:hypothetical protein
MARVYVLTIKECSWRWLIEIDEHEPVDIVALAFHESRKQTCESLYGEPHTDSIN